MSYQGQSLKGSLTPLQRCNRCILQSQPIGPWWGILPLCKDAIGVFYSLSRLGLGGEFYPSTEMQLVYSTAPSADWASIGGFTPLQRCSRYIHPPPQPTGLQTQEVDQHSHPEVTDLWQMFEVYMEIILIITYPNYVQILRRSSWKNKRRLFWNFRVIIHISKTFNIFLSFIYYELLASFYWVWHTEDSFRFIRRISDYTQNPLKWIFRINIQFYLKW